MTTGLILGAAVWADGPSPTLRRRVLHGLSLFQQGAVDRLICCGGMGTHPPTEAEAMRRLLLEEGVPVAAIVLEDQSTTTAENIRNAKAFLNDPRVIVITDWYHAPRARMVARREGLAATSSSPSLRGAKLVPQTLATLREIPAFAAYFVGIKGR